MSRIPVKFGLEELNWCSLTYGVEGNGTIEEAFQNAIEICANTFPAEDVKHWRENKIGISDVHKAVLDAEQIYHKKKRSKAAKWLTRLSARINLYGSALDMLAQHHPEYLALAWGSIKFVVIGLINHEDLVKELAKALCRIGDALPQAQVHLYLYPTASMKELVVALYVQIIKFARRATKWFNESRARHVISSITHPYSLRFKDMVDAISETSRRIERLALNMSLAELRQTRIELENTRREQREIHDIAVQTNHKIDAYHTIQNAGLIDTNRRVCEIQFSQLMTFTSASPFPTPEFSRNYYTLRRNRNRRRGSENTKIFQESTHLRSWASQMQSSQLAICGGFDTRQVIRDLAADTIDLITEANIPVVWALNLPCSELQYSPEDVLKYVVSQVLRTNHTLLSERSAALNAARYQSATSLEDWFAILGSVLEGLPQAYFIIDLELLQKSTGTVTSWTQLFQCLFESLEARGARTILKVAFLGSRTAHRSSLGALDQGRILQLPKTRTGRVTKVSAKADRSRQRRRLLQPAIVRKTPL